MDLNRALHKSFALRGFHTRMTPERGQVLREAPEAPARHGPSEDKRWRQGVTLVTSCSPSSSRRCSWSMPAGETSPSVRKHCICLEIGALRLRDGRFYRCNSSSRARFSELYSCRVSRAAGSTSSIAGGVSAARISRSKRSTTRAWIRPYDWGRANRVEPDTSKSGHPWDRRCRSFADASRSRAVLETVLLHDPQAIALRRSHCHRAPSESHAIEP